MAWTWAVAWIEIQQPASPQTTFAQPLSFLRAQLRRFRSAVGQSGLMLGGWPAALLIGSAGGGHIGDVGAIIVNAVLLAVALTGIVLSVRVAGGLRAVTP